MEANREERKLPRDGEGAQSSPGVVEGGGGDGLRELLEVNPTITVSVSLLDHAGELLGGEGVAEASHGMSELCGGDESIAIAIKHTEKLAELVLGVGRLGREEIRGDEGYELGELHEAIGVGVRLLDQRLQLIRAGLQPKRSEKRSELQLRQTSIIVPIERSENLSQLSELLVIQLHRLSSAHLLRLIPLQNLAKFSQISDPKPIH